MKIKEIKINKKRSEQVILFLSGIGTSLSIQGTLLLIVTKLLPDAPPNVILTTILSIYLLAIVKPYLYSKHHNLPSELFYQGNLLAAAGVAIVLNIL